MAQNVDLEFRASGSLFRDLEVMQAQVNGLGEAHKKVHEGIQSDLSESAESTKKFGASVSAAGQLVVALAKSAGQGLPALAKSLAEVADLTEQARSGLSSTDRTNLSNVNQALRGIADTQGLVVRQVNAEKKARIDALVEAKKITKEEANLLEETTAVVDTLKEAAVASTELAVSLDGPIEQGATLAQQYRAAVLEAQRIGQEFGTNSDEFLEATKRAAALKKEIADVGDRIRALNPGDKLGAFTQFGNAVASGAQAVGGFFVAFAGGNQVLQETIFKFQSLLFAVQGFQGFVRDFKDAFDNVRAVLGLTTAATEASTIASEVDTVAKGEQAAATTAVGTASAGATTGIRAFTASLLANPIFAAVAVLAALAGAMLLFANNTEQAVETYDDLLERLNRPIRRTQLEGELEQAKLLADQERARLKRIEDFQAGRRKSIEQTTDEIQADAQRQQAIDDKLRGAALNSIDAQRAAFSQLQDTKRRAVVENRETGEQEVADTAAFTALKKKLGLDEAATLTETIKAYYDRKAQFREAELQGEAELASRRQAEARAEAERLEQAVAAEQAAAELRLRIREELAAGIEAIEKELADKIAALELDQADPMEQVNLRKAAADEEINNLERNLRREIALQELRVKVGDETFDKLTERQRQARADEIIAAGGGRLAVEQQEQFNTLRLLNEEAYIRERQAQERANQETLLSIQAEGADRERAQLELDLQARAEELRKAGATEEQITRDATNKRIALNDRLASEALSLEEQTQLDLAEVRLAGAAGNAAAERAAQIEILSIRLEFAQRALALIRDDDTAAARIAAAKAAVAKLQGELDQVKSQVVPFSLLDLLGFKLSDPDRQKVEQALNSIGQSILQVVNTGIQARQAELDAQRSINEEIISDNENRIQELEQQLKEEEDLQRQGLANNVDAVRAAIEEKKRLEQEALAEKRRLQAEQRKLAREQAIVDSASQASALLTAGATLFKAEAFKGVVGIVTSIATIAGMIASFVALKAKLASATTTQQFYKGTKSVKRGPGEAPGIDTVHAMLTEDEAVVPVKSNRKHRGLVGAIIDDDFSKLRPSDLQHLLDSIDLTDMLRGTGVRVNTRALRQDIQAGAKASAPAPSVDVKGLESRLDALTAEVVALRKDAKARPSTEVMPDGSIVTRRPGEVHIRRP